MFTIDTWDAVFFAIAALVAVTALVRLMAARRNELVDDIERQISAERQRQKKRRKKKPKDAA